MYMYNVCCLLLIACMCIYMYSMRVVQFLHSGALKDCDVYDVLYHRYAEEVNNNFLTTLDWLHEHACSRVFGLGQHHTHHTHACRHTHICAVYNAVVQSHGFEPSLWLVHVVYCVALCVYQYCKKYAGTLVPQFMIEYSTHRDSRSVGPSVHD